MTSENLPQNHRQKQLAIIVDLDETLCTQFDVPVESGVAVLRRIDQSKLHVHYVTARTAICRAGTERFVRAYHLPGIQNVHYCPESIKSLEHKRRLHEALSRKFEVIASIGDSFEEQQAAATAGIYFVEVDSYEPAGAWSILAQRLAGFGEIMRP